MRAAKLLFLFICFVCGVDFAQANSCADLLSIVRVREYQSVTFDSLQYDGSKIFKDPQDTETVSAVGLIAVRPGDFVLDLGSGSGIPANAFSQQGKASKVVGIDVSEVSVEHAQRRYGSQNVSFKVGNYEDSTIPQILSAFCSGKIPDLIVSNPPYVPSVGHPSGLLRTIDGGPDGLRFIRRVIEIGSSLNTRLAFIMGSYSSPKEAFRLLFANGYKVSQLTLSVLPFGAFSEANSEQILKLEKTGQAFLLRSVFKDRLAYVAIGVVAEPVQDRSKNTLFDIEGVLKELQSSTSSDLETLPTAHAVPIRVLVLDDFPVNSASPPSAK